MRWTGYFAMRRIGVCSFCHAYCPSYELASFMTETRGAMPERDGSVAHHLVPGSPVLSRSPSPHVDLSRVEPTMSIANKDIPSTKVRLGLRLRGRVRARLMMK